MNHQDQNPHAIHIGINTNPPTKHSNRLRSSCLFSILKKIVCVCVLLCALSIFHAYIIILLSIVLLLLTVALVVIRFIQSTKNNDTKFTRVIQLKFLVRSWISITTLSTLILAYIGGHVPFPHPPVLLELVQWPLLHILIGFYCFSCALPVVVHRLLPRIELDRYEGGINVPEAASELINCLVFWVVETKLLKYLFPFNSREMGVNTWRWVEKVIVGIIGYNGIRLSSYGMVWLLKKVCRALDPGPRANPHWYLLVLDNLLPRKQVVYYTNGMKSSIAFILSSTMLLLIWASYFEKRLKRVEQLTAFTVSWMVDFTFLSLIICSFLWLLKTFVLLAWEANVVYLRLEPQILEARKQLYFLGLLGRHKYDIFHLLYHDDLPKNIFLRFCRSFFEVATPDIKYRSKTDDEDCWIAKKLSTQKKEVVRDDLLMPKGYTSSLHDIKEVTLYLQEAKDALGSKSYVSNILQYLRSNNPSKNDLGMREEHLKQLINATKDSKDQASSELVEDNVQPSSSEGNASNNFKSLTKEKENVNIQNSSKEVDELQTENDAAEENEDNDWKCFQHMLNEAELMAMTSKLESFASHDDGRGSDVQNVSHGDSSSSEQVISFRKIQIWTEIAQKNCIFLANAVSSGTELVNYLNAIISGFIIVATFIMWLLVTQLASTKVFVVIASPLLAASFIFGDTCKNLFHSIIFVYVLHPFDVGDLCDIDEDCKMEAKSIGVWKTTFSKMDEFGNQVDVIYPNSELANKKVINYKTKLNVHYHVK